MVKKLNYKAAAAVLAVIVTLFIVASAAGRGTAGAVTDSGGKIELPVILYHEVRYNKNGKLAISPYEFESDLKYIKDEGYTTVTVADLVNYVTKGVSLPEKPIMLTFDDGYLNDYVYAFPLIKKYNMKIVFSVIAKNTDDFTKVKDDNIDYSHVTWEQLNEMIQSGLVEVQNHTYNMHSISLKRYGCSKNPGESIEHYESALSDDLLKCQNEISLNTGVVPTAFTYPYGRVSGESLPVIKKLGFKASFSCKYGINMLNRDPEKLYCLKRVSRYHGTTLKKTIAKAEKTLRKR